jgi:hypothetical protein
MADGDRPAVRVDPRILEIHLHQFQATEHLAREGLVDLDDVHVLEIEFRPLECTRDRVRRSHAHDARLDARACRRQNSSDGLFAFLFAPRLRADDERRSAVVNA